MPGHAPPSHQTHALRICSETATTATTLPACGVGGSGCDVLDAANAHTGTGESAESGLGTGAGGLGAVTTGGTDLDVEGRDAELLAAGGWRHVSVLVVGILLSWVYAPTSWAANMAA